MFSLNTGVRILQLQGVLPVLTGRKMLIKIMISKRSGFKWLTYWIDNINHIYV